MSGFFSSLLASVGGRQPGGQPSPASPATPQSTTSKSAQLPTSASTASSSTTNGVMAASKRKAEGDLNKSAPKNPRKSTLPPLKTASNPVSRSSTSSPGIKSQSAPLPSVPYRGTAKVNGTNTHSTNAKPAVKPLNAAAARPATLVAAPSTKKTGYQAILERAKQAEQAQQSIGTIKHKPVEKMTRKERLEKEQEAKRNVKAGKFQKTSSRTPNRATTPSSGKPGEPAKEKRKPVDVGYKGTMRPSDQVYKGTMKGPTSAATSRRPGEMHKPKNGRYAGYSDEEEDEDDNESDASSDMEAGAWDLEAEEAFSSRLAKKEDLAALEEENELKKQKEARRRRLMELANEKAAKKKRF